MSQLSNAVEQIIIPRTADIGGFEVHRALPFRNKRMVGPFIFWDQMGPGEFLTGKGVDVRPHPHIGLSTVTWLFSGTLDHKDSLGYDQRITPGEVNLMTAGSGIVHSERTGQDIRHAGPSELFGIQSWLALPQDQEEMDCTFQNVGRDNLPVYVENGLEITQIMGEGFGLKSPVTSHWDTFYTQIKMNAGTTIPVPDHIEEAALYALGGTVEIGGVRYDPHQMLVLDMKNPPSVKALEDCTLMILGGAVMDGPRHIWWNFVSSRKDRIDQAKEEWETGKFLSVPNDNEFIPLPEQ